MPPLRQPKPLFRLCLKQAQVLIRIASDNIGNRFGHYQDTLAAEAIQEIQQHLLSVVGGFYLDKIVNLYRRKLFISMKYATIFFSICLHTNMKEMSIRNHFFSWHSCRFGRSGNTDKFDADFWMYHLPRLTQLVRLNLGKTCNDSVLEAVGQYCRKLEVIEIDFEASSKGLKCLLNCKDLREINGATDCSSYMNDTVASLFLRSLPKLQSVFCYLLGEVLNGMDDVSSLQLVSVYELDSKPQYIQDIARLCPNITRLKLSNHYEEFGTKTATTLKALAMSDLRVPYLDLHNFYFASEMKCLLTLKGIFITDLQFSLGFNSWVLSHSDIAFIGTTCLNLKNLHIEVYRISRNNTERTDSMNPIFCRLESLHIDCENWDYSLLPVVLTHALNIKTLELTSLSYVHDDDLYPSDDEDDEEWVPMTPLDIVFDALILVNPMAELQSIKLHDGARITINVLNKLIDSCPQLSMFYMQDLVDQYELRQLNKQMREDNLYFRLPNLL